MTKIKFGEHDEQDGIEAEKAIAEAIVSAVNHFLNTGMNHADCLNGVSNAHFQLMMQHVYRESECGCEDCVILKYMDEQNELNKALLSSVPQYHQQFIKLLKDMDDERGPRPNCSASTAEREARSEDSENARAADKS